MSLTRKLMRTSRQLGACLAAAATLLLLSACATDGDEKPPVAAADVEVETAQPDWTAESAAPPVAPVKKAPSPRQAPKPRVEAPPYLVSTPASAEVDAQAHMDSLLGIDAAVLHANEVGYYVDTQEARLIQLLKDTGIAATRDADVLSFTIGGGDTFASNGTQLSDSARTRLEPLARVLEEYDRTRISIFGYTDDVGETDYNQQLSVRRARAIARLLVDSGVAPERLFIVGYGELNPVAGNDSEAGRARNRRIELRVEPLTRPVEPAAE